MDIGRNQSLRRKRWEINPERINFNIKKNFRAVQHQHVTMRVGIAI